MGSKVLDFQVPISEDSKISGFPGSHPALSGARIVGALSLTYHCLVRLIWDERHRFCRSKTFRCWCRIHICLGRFNNVEYLSAVNMVPKFSNWSLPPYESMLSHRRDHCVLHASRSNEYKNKQGWKHIVGKRQAGTGASVETLAFSERALFALLPTRVRKCPPNGVGGIFSC